MDYYSKIPAWVSFWIDSPKNLATREELIAQAKVAIKYFIEADIDKSLSLTFEELKLLSDRLGLPMEKDEEDMLHKMDEDGSGGLDIEEWVKWWLGRISSLPNPAKQQEAIAKNTFKKFDEDESGFVDASELKNLIDDLGASFSEDELAQALAEIDTDGSGKIECSEFVAWFTSRSSRDNTSLVSIKLRKLAAKAALVFSTDIFTACWEGNEYLVRSFLEAESRTALAFDTSEFGGGWRPLHYASYKGHLKIVEMLLEVGEKINKEIEEQNLQRDKKAKKVEKVEIVNARNDLGFTPLFYSAQQGHIDVCKLLMNNNADPTIGGSHAEDESIFMCPIDHCFDEKNLKQIFETHPKCKPPKILSISPIKQFDVAIGGKSGSVTLTIKEEQQKVSSIPITHFKLSLRALTENIPGVKKLKLDFDSLIQAELTIPSIKPFTNSLQPKTSMKISSTLEPKFLSFVRFYGLLKHINSLQLVQSNKLAVKVLWDQFSKVYLAIDPTFRVHFPVEETFAVALNRGDSNPPFQLIRMEFLKHIMAERASDAAKEAAIEAAKTAKGDAKSEAKAVTKGSAGDDARRQAKDDDKGFTVERMTEVIENFVKEPKVSEEKDTKAQARSVKGGAAASGDKKAAAAAGSSETESKPLPKATAEAKDTAAGAGDDDSDAKATDAKDAFIDSDHSTKFEVYQSLMVKVASKNALFESGYSDEIEVSFRIL